MSIVETLYQTRNVPDAELTTLLTADQFDQELFRKADERRREFYGTEVFVYADSSNSPTTAKTIVFIAAGNIFATSCNWQRNMIHCTHNGSPVRCRSASYIFGLETFPHAQWIDELF